MFKGLGQMASLLKNAGEMQGRMQQIQENMKRLRVTGSAGGGMVTVEMNGQQQVLSCSIEESLVKSGDREVLEDLVVSACNQALDKVRQASAEEMSKLAGGIDMPGLGEALAKFTGGSGGL